MKILIAGSSGFLGTALLRQWRAQGHTVVRLVRRTPTGPDEILWAPDTTPLDPAVLADVDAVVNLAGANVGEALWTRSRRELLVRSRLGPTTALATALRGASRRPRVLLNASATGYYGSRGDEGLTEDSAGAAGFLARMCTEWEQAARAAQSDTTRVVSLRFGIVLGREGALAAMMKPFRAGFGARLGDGRHWISWVALEDVLGIIDLALHDPRLSGPVNLTAPQAVTNADFTDALASAVGSRARLVAPAWLLRLLPGRMADEALLASARVVPARIQAAGYVFRQPELAGALRVLGPNG